jgi:sugar phosphate isomerase/epimerase
MGVSGVEVAPGRISDWSSLDKRCIKEYKTRLLDAGLVVSSLQAIYFGMPELQLLSDESSFFRLRKHTIKVAEIATELDAKIIVFGAPRNRTKGQLSTDEAFKIGLERFQTVAEDIESSGVILGIEPVPAFYGGDFLVSAPEALAMVKAVNKPAIKLHLDVGCVTLNEDDIAEAVYKGIDVLAHFHVSQPKLGDFSEPLTAHARAAEALHKVNYSGWISIEMLTNASDPVSSVARAIEVTKSTYSNFIKVN